MLCKKCCQNGTVLDWYSLFLPCPLFRARSCRKRSWSCSAGSPSAPSSSGGQEDICIFGKRQVRTQSQCKDVIGMNIYTHINYSFSQALYHCRFERQKERKKERKKERPAADWMGAPWLNEKRKTDEESKNICFLLNLYPPFFPPFLWSGILE